MKRCALSLAVVLAWWTLPGLNVSFCAQEQRDDLNWTARFLEQQLRAERWALVLPRDNPERFRQKLMEMKAVVAIEEQPYSYRLASDLGKQPVQFTALKQDEYRNLFGKHFFCLTQDEAWIAPLAKALGLRTVPRSVGIGLPLFFEEMMVGWEISHHGLAEEEIDKKQTLTVFNMVQEAGAWKAEVVHYAAKKDIRKQPKSDWMVCRMPLIDIPVEPTGGKQESGKENRQGNGFGGGHGDGVGRGGTLGKRYLRQTRWILVLPLDDAETFRKKLVELKAIVLVPYGESVNSFYVCENMHMNPLDLKKTDQTGVNQYNRLWYMSHSKTDCEFIGKALKLEKPPRWMAIFIPHDLEDTLAQAEFKHQKLSDEELNKRKWVTIFTVDRKDNKWNVQVRYQGLRKEQSGLKESGGAGDPPVLDKSKDPF